MFKKVLIVMTLLIGGSCVAMTSPRGQFLDFVGAEIGAGLATVRDNITINASDETSAHHEISRDFIARFSECFNGNSVPIPIAHIYSDVMLTAARNIGLAYLEDGEKRDNVQSLNIAIAFFQSVPKETPSTGGMDRCSVDFIEIATKKRSEIEQRNQLFQQIRDSNPSEFFQ